MCMFIYIPDLSQVFIRRLCCEIFQVNKNSQQSPHSEAHRSLRYYCWPVGLVQQLLQYFLKLGHKVQLVVIKYGMETQQWEAGEGSYPVLLVLKSYF